MREKAIIKEVLSCLCAPRWIGQCLGMPAATRSHHGDSDSVGWGRILASGMLTHRRPDDSAAGGRKQWVFGVDSVGISRQGGVSWKAFMDSIPCRLPSDENVRLRTGEGAETPW